MNYDTKRSGAYIQSLRIQHGYTQGQMAKALNMDRSYLSRIESGAKGCSVDLFIQLSEFLHKLKKYKTIKVDGGEDGKGGLDTLTIDIPVEAREKMLAMTRKAIFEQGMGIDPDPQNFGNSSGVALSYLYSLLEIKAGLMETEFRSGFGRLVKAICRYLGKEPDGVGQIWTRTSVRNDSELAAIASQSVGVISRRTIAANHPWVDDVEKELAQIRQEEDAEGAGPYDPFEQKSGSESGQEKKQQKAREEEEGNPDGIEKE